MWMPRALVATSLAASALVACGSANDGPDVGNGELGGAGRAGDADARGDGGGLLDGIGGSGGSSGGGANGGLLDAAPGDSPASNDCSDAAKLIYVVTQQNDLLSFSPPTLTLTPIGKLRCSAGGATPFSMGIARNGAAWVLYTDGRIFNVSTADASCTPTSYAPNQHGWKTFGMAFVSDSPGSASEALYVADFRGGGLGKVDAHTLQLSLVGPWQGISGSAELTGTGEARLFGFWRSSPVNVAEVDKSTGDILATHPQPSVNIGSGWAFAHWGGSFWLFTAPRGSSQVDQFDPATGATTTVKSGLGYIIVGAGVSTCAPTSMVR